MGRAKTINVVHTWELDGVLSFGSVNSNCKLKKFNKFQQHQINHSKRSNTQISLRNKRRQQHQQHRLQGTLAPSPMANVTGWGWAESRTSPELSGLLTRTLPEVSWPILWRLWRCNQLCHKLEASYSSYANQAEVCGRLLWAWFQLALIANMLNHSHSGKTAHLCKSHQVSFVHNQHLKLSSWAIGLLSTALCLASSHLWQLSQMHIWYWIRHSRVTRYRSTALKSQLQSKLLTNCDFCKGDTRHATTTLQPWEISKKSWQHAETSSQSSLCRWWYLLKHHCSGQKCVWILRHINIQRVSSFESFPHVSSMPIVFLESSINDSCVMCSKAAPVSIKAQSMLASCFPNAQMIQNNFNCHIYVHT